MSQRGQQAADVIQMAAHPLGACAFSLGDFPDPLLTRPHHVVPLQPARPGAAQHLCPERAIGDIARLSTDRKHSRNSPEQEAGITGHPCKRHGARSTPEVVQDDIFVLGRRRAQLLQDGILHRGFPARSRGLALQS